MPKTTLFDTLLRPYHRRKLDADDGYKPLDFGGGGLNGSINREGRMIAINTYHPDQGYVTLTSVAPFSEDQRYNQEAVRAYRRGLTQQLGFGLEFRLNVVEHEAWLIEDAVPYIRLTLEGDILADCVTFSPLDMSGNVIQFWAFSDAGQFGRLSGRMWLQRAAYTQLTEGGPLTMPSVNTRPVLDTGELRPVGLQNPDVKWNMFFSSGTTMKANDDGSVSFDQALLRAGESDWIYPQTIQEGMHLPGIGLTTPDETIPAVRETFFNFRCDYVRPDAMVRSGDYKYGEHFNMSDIKNLLTDHLNMWHERWSGWHYTDRQHMITDRLLRRGLVYGFNCCIPVDEDAVCIITDHMLLPLSWNRDSYYVARALLNWREDMQEVVAQHLIWLFERAERDQAGAWGRAYLVNGKIKDAGFQLDQQIYPLLELAEYVLETHDYNMWERLKKYVYQTIDMLYRRKADGAWLFPTEETPADDPIAMPYHLSSHILLWRTLGLLDRLSVEKDFMADAREVRAAIAEYFIAEDADGQMLYAYASDGADGYHFYQDANDIPFVMAPLWGMLPPEDPVWRATAEFSFSEKNKGGAYSGRLGSVHTPAPWPLGDIQEMVIARLTKNREREEETRHRLILAAQWDGALPEAYNAESYTVASRHWFAWPNAMLPVIDRAKPPEVLEVRSSVTPAAVNRPQGLFMSVRKRIPLLRVGFIATRLGGVDGVSWETAKIVRVLEEMGHDCFYCAGELGSDAKEGWLVPSMHFYDPVSKRIYDEVFRNPNPKDKIYQRIYRMADTIRQSIEGFIDEFDINLLVPQNASTIPVNIPLGVAIAEIIRRTRIKTICHHHDFYWERDRFINNGIQDVLDDAFPPDLEPIRHIVINSVMQRRLKAFRGIQAVYLPNVFDFEEPPQPMDAYARSFREEIGLNHDDLIVLQPTRLIRRKKIEKAFELVRELNDDRLVLLITGSVDDEPGEYGRWLMKEAERSGIRYKFIGERIGEQRGTHNGQNVFRMWDVYPHAHIVTYPSSYEGFGNALLEAIYFKKPIVVHRYGPYVADIKPVGVQAVEFYHDITEDVLRQTRQIIDDPRLRREMVNHNYQVSVEHFSFKVLRNTLRHVLETFDW